jgi:hypothetical protein
MIMMGPIESKSASSDTPTTRQVVIVVIVVIVVNTRLSTKAGAYNAWTFFDFSEIFYRM